MLKKRALAIMAGSVLTGAASLANADGVATTYLAIKDFQFVDTSTDAALVVGSDLLFEGPVTNNGDTSATLDGENESFTDDAPASAEGFDVTSACVGDCSYTENSFSYIEDPAEANGTYALGDVLLEGAAVEFPGASAGADATTLAEVSLGESPTVGSAEGNNVGVRGSFNFISNVDAEVEISYLADIYLRTLISAEESGINADATSLFSISIRDRTAGTRFFYSPGELNVTIASTLPGQNELYSLADWEDESGDNIFNLVSDNRYTLSISQQSGANARLTPQVPVPVPATLALYGLGLVSLAMYRRRRAI